MRRFKLAVLPLVLIACSSGNFDVAESAPDIGSTDDGGDDAPPIPDTGGTLEDATSPTDTGVIGPDADAACPGVTIATTDVYVNGGAPSGGKGTIGCPFRTLAQAAAAPIGTSTSRIVHVQNGTYAASTGVKIRPRETYKGEGGYAKVVVPATATLCPPSGVSCAFVMEASSVLDSFIIDGGGVAVGVVVNAAGSAETRPRITNTAVKNMARDGIIVFGAGVKLGPNAQATDNGHSGLVVRAGSVSVDGGGNAFDRNKGGFWSSGTFIPGSGIHVYGGTLFVDNGASASNNHTGVTFDASGFSSSQQILSQIDIVGNRTNGVVVNKDWTKLQVRKVSITKNTLAGLYLVYNATATNVFDLGPDAATGPGNNIFGGSLVKNLKAGLFLCQSGATGSLRAERNTWTACPPTQLQVANCDTMPATYVDVAYVPAVSASGTTFVNPLSPPSACTAS